MQASPSQASYFSVFFFTCIPSTWYSSWPIESAQHIFITWKSESRTFNVFFDFPPKNSPFHFRWCPKLCQVWSGIGPRPSDFSCHFWWDQELDFDSKKNPGAGSSLWNCETAFTRLCGGYSEPHHTAPQLLPGGRTHPLISEPLPCAGCGLTGPLHCFCEFFNEVPIMCWLSLCLHVLKNLQWFPICPPATPSP